MCYSAERCHHFVTLTTYYCCHVVSTRASHIGGPRLKSVPADSSHFFHVLWNSLLTNHGARGSVVVKALCYKPEGRGFETR
jgi:hypothetical protein